MAVKGTSPIRVESNIQGIAVVLRLAVCEWLLLCLLLFDAAFSYFLTKFAQYCGLQLPCILCSRLDHVFGKEEPDFYKNLLCNDHRSEISSLVTCHYHDKLADIHELCDECLLSFAKQESNEETYKHLVGEPGPDCFQTPFLSMDYGSGTLTTRLCSCCSKPWRTRPHVQKLANTRPSASFSKPNIPLPKSAGHRFLNRQDGLKKKKDRFSLSTTPLVLGSKDYDTLSHMGYTEVKITSDSDSDFLFSDDEDMLPAPRDRRNVIDEFISHRGSKFLPKSQYDDLHPTAPLQKPTHTTGMLMHPDLEPEKGETTTPKFYVPSGDLRHIYGDVNWKQTHKKPSPPLTRFGSMEDIPLISSAPGIPSVESVNERDTISLPKNFGNPGLPELIDKIGFPSNNLQFAVESSKANWLDSGENGDIRNASTISKWGSFDLHNITTRMGIDADQMRKDSAVMTSSCPVIGARDLAFSKEVKASSSSAELDKNDCITPGSTEETSTLKASPCETPTVKGHADGPSINEAPCSIGSLMSSRSSSIERSRSLESSELSVSEIEGENRVDRLRREVKHDKKRISNLYEELEEERNAAAIAANQAMAMITRLQEEKAALHMEALQYLREMEEQVEHNEEALEKANRTIDEKEKEIQDLEAELDYFRINYRDDFPDDYSTNGMDMEDVQGSSGNLEDVQGSSGNLEDVQGSSGNLEDVQGSCVETIKTEKS